MKHTKVHNTDAKEYLDSLTQTYDIFDVKYFLNFMAPISNEEAAGQAANWISASFKGELPKYKFPEYDLPA